MTIPYVLKIDLNNKCAIYYCQKGGLKLKVFGIPWVIFKISKNFLGQNNINHATWSFNF